MARVPNPEADSARAVARTEVEDLRVRRAAPTPPRLGRRAPLAGGLPRYTRVQSAIRLVYLYGAEDGDLRVTR